MADKLTRPVDVEALTTGVRRRWGIVCVGVVLLTVGRSLGLSEQTPWIIFSFAAVGVSANLLLLRILDSQWYRPWLVFVYCLLDLLLVGLAIVYLGPGGAIAAFFLVIVPCASRPGRALGAFALVAASLVFVAAAALHGIIAGPQGGSAGSTSRTLLDLVFLVSVAATLVAAHTNLYGRIAKLQVTIGNANDGDFGMHSFAIRNDSLGLVEQSLNDVLKQTASMIAAVGREIEEVAVLGGTVAQSTDAAVGMSQRITSVTAELSTQLEDLSAAAKAGEEICSDSVRDAQDLQTHAEGGAGSVRELEENAEVGRERISRTIETLLAVRNDIERTARIVEELSGLSKQIGSSAISIAKVARHTHILALNAAIEAARAEEHGAEFAVVADQVRTLAGEAGRSARDVGDLVSEINAGIAAAASALAASEEKVNDVSQIADEGRSALAHIRTGSVAAADFVTATTASSQSQASSAHSLVEIVSRFRDAIARWTTEVQTASTDVAGQMSVLGDLDRTCVQLTAVADRLREEVSRFSGKRI